VNVPRALFGEAVRRYRQRLKIFQEELAHRADLDGSYIGQVERGGYWDHNKIRGCGRTIVRTATLKYDTLLIVSKHDRVARC
jgi:predicted transcriptional regulator